MDKILAVIPARYNSSRFPGKPLFKINGKEMILRTYERVRQATKIDEVVVATDDDRIFNLLKSMGVTVVYTSPDCLNGTERVAEYAAIENRFPIIINVQGDEPYIKAEQIDALAEIMLKTQNPIGTLVHKITTEAELNTHHTVKVIFNNCMEAVYFSRYPIPFIQNLKEDLLRVEQFSFYKHIGIYGFRRDVLLKLSTLSPHPVEISESLEQLRWLMHGYKISVGISPFDSYSVDTPESLEILLDKISAGEIN